MNKVLKLVGLIIGSLIVGGVIGWLCDQIGISTPVAVAIILAAFSVYESKKKN